MKQFTYSPKKREKEILDNLLRFRYLNRPQIQDILKHKSKTKIIEWLNNLTNKQYIFRFYTKQYAGIPAIYCLDKNSTKYFRVQKIEEHIIKRIYEEKVRTQEFRDRSIFIAQFFLDLEKHTKNKKASLNFYTQMDLENIDHLPNNLPHAYFSIKQKNKRTERYFLEVFDLQPPRFWMRERIDEYIEYFQSDEWQDNTDTKFPEVILITPDEKSERYLNKRIKEQVEDWEMGFNIITYSKAQSQDFFENLL